MRDQTLTVARSFVPLLTRWGATPEADLVFRSLAEYGPQTAADLSRSLGLPGRRVRPALDELAEAGAVRRIRPTEGIGEVWVSEPLKAAVARIRGRRQAAEQAMLRVRRRLATLDDLGNGCQPDTAQAAMMSPLYGLARARARLAELVGQTRSEHLSMHPEPAFSANVVRAAAPLNRSMVARKLTVLTLGVPARTGDTTASHTAELVSAGLQYRELPALPTKLQIFDRRTVLLPIDPDEPARGMVELFAPSTVQGVVTWFLSWWERSQPPRSVMAMTVRLTQREQAIVTLLAAGHTDSSASAELGLSLRTVGYAIRALMDRYGVQNRFQLGLLLGASGARTNQPDEVHQEPT
jgi:DNA-binding CsgD family transcriptional regulator/DNA-binding transcriptional ArsR family regulator